MLLSRPAAWGVDLTGGAVRAVHVERRGSHYRIVDAVVQPISPAGEGAEPLRAHLPDTVGRGLTDLLQTRRPTLADPLFVAMPSFGSRHGRLEVPGSDPAQVRGLVDFELHHALKGDLEPWIVRLGAPASNGRGAVAAEFHAHRRELVQTFVADVRRFGMPFDALVPGPIALARYADLEWPARAGGGRRLVLEVQRTRTDFLYSGEHGPRWRTLPFGSGVLPEGAVDAAAHVKVDRLASQILREHQAAQRALFGAHDGTALERIVLLGDGAHHDALRKALAERFGVEIVVPIAARHVDVGRRALAAAGTRVLHFGTAIGLAIAALSSEGEASSLSAPPPARRALRRLPAFSASLLLMALGLLATRVVAERTTSELEAELPRARDGVRWTATADWDAARASAIAAAAESRRRIGEAAALRREIGFPSRLLGSLVDVAFPCRLVAIDLAPGDERDTAALTFDLGNGMRGGADALKEQLERHAAVTVTSVESSKGENGELLITLHVEVRAPEAGP